MRATSWSRVTVRSSLRSIVRGFGDLARAVWALVRREHLCVMESTGKPREYFYRDE